MNGWMVCSSIEYLWYRLSQAAAEGVVAQSGVYDGTVIGLDR
jgi:hypothetical protein